MTESDSFYFAPRCQFAEVFIIQDVPYGQAIGIDAIQAYYQGVYLLVEKIARDPNRVDIKKLRNRDNSGGYILELGVPKANQTQVYSFKTDYILKYPPYIDILQTSWIEGYLNAFEWAVGNLTDFNSYLYTDTFIDAWLISEFTRNTDAWRLSTYFYKDRQDKLIMGPIWGFEVSFSPFPFPFPLPPLMLSSEPR